MFRKSTSSYHLLQMAFATRSREGIHHVTTGRHPDYVIVAQPGGAGLGPRKRTTMKRVAKVDHSNPSWAEMQPGSTTHLTIDRWLEDTSSEAQHIIFS